MRHRGGGVGGRGVVSECSGRLIIIFLLKKTGFPP